MPATMSPFGGRHLLYQADVANILTPPVERLAGFFHVYTTETCACICHHPAQQANPQIPTQESRP
jgi:hypothetical protein